MDGVDLLPSSEMSYTHFEACEEDRKASDKKVANGSNRNTEVYHSETHKAQTLLNVCKPIKLGGPVAAAQGKAVVTGGKHGEGKKVLRSICPMMDGTHRVQQESPIPLNLGRKVVWTKVTNPFQAPRRQIP